MYILIGADQKEYGPVSAEQVRNWITQGRANGQTRARAEVGGDWKPLLDFPEFAGRLAGQFPATPLMPPKIAAADAERLAGEIIARDYRVDLGDCFSRSWSLVRDNFWLLVGATALVFVVRAGLGFFPILGIPTNVILGFALQGGLCLLFLKRLRGEPADMSVAFSGITLALLPLILASVVAHALTFIGFFLFVLPAVYLLVAWWLFTPLLILDKHLEFWPALECSRKVVTHHWWLCFGLFIVACLVALVGSLACGVGIFFTLPIAVGATVYAYEDIFGACGAATGLLAPPSPESAAKSPAAPEPAPTPEPPSNADSASSAPLSDTQTPSAPPESSPPSPPLAP